MCVCSHYNNHVVGTWYAILGIIAHAKPLLFSLDSGSTKMRLPALFK